MSIAGASISWAGTHEGTVSNPHGEFLLPKNTKSDKLIVSYTGFKTDTISINGLQDIQNMLRGTLRMPGFCKAWNALTASEGRIRSIASRDWLCLV